MSRAFDNYMADKFEINGTLYELVEPQNLAELNKAIEVRDIIQIQIDSMMHDEDDSGYQDVLYEQQLYIDSYMEALGEFDNENLANNIAFLLKKNNMRVGELEHVLGISTGYISRTAKAGSNKKMSIDVVWKIAKLFEVDIDSLVSEDLTESRKNTELLVDFIERLYKDTEDNFFGWSPAGGVIYELDQNYEDCGLIENDNEYTDHNLSSEYTWVLSGDIVYLECFEENKDLVIIPYHAKEHAAMWGFDFLLAWDYEENFKYEKLFTTYDDPFGKLKEAAQKLYSLIEDREFDTKITAKTQSMIMKYLKGGRPD